MTLLEQIKAQYLELRKARATSQVASLSTLLGEIDTLTKSGKGELTDDAVVAVVKKFIKNLDESIKANSERGNHTTAGQLADEKNLYAQFLPKQFSEVELDNLIGAIILTGAGTVGEVMKELKVKYSGQYDGAVAARILKLRFA